MPTLPYRRRGLRTQAALLWDAQKLGLLRAVAKLFRLQARYSLYETSIQACAFARQTQ